MIIDDLDDLFQRLRVWPIWLDIEGKRGMTLFVTADNGQYLLATGHYVLLFPSTAGLGTFIDADHSSNLVAVPGYRMFQHQWRADPDMIAEPDVVYEADTLFEILDEDWNYWSREEAREVLHTLNIMWDIAATVDNLTALAYMKDQNGLGKFLDVLTFFDADGRKELEDLNQDDMREATAEVVKMVLPNIVTIE